MYYRGIAKNWASQIKDSSDYIIDITIEDTDHVDADLYYYMYYFYYNSGVYKIMRSKLAMGDNVNDTEPKNVPLGDIRDILTHLLIKELLKFFYFLPQLQISIYISFHMEIMAM